MKIAVSSTGKEKSSVIDQRFGRCLYFYLYDTDTKEGSIIDNSVQVNLSGGAGIQTAQKIVDQDVSIVITGHCGPKAFRVLAESGLKVYSAETCTVEDAVKLFEANKLQSLNAPDVQGHWM